jgi:hypothetical protein
MYRIGIGKGSLGQRVARPQRIEDHAAVGQKTFSSLFDQTQRIGEHFNRIGLRQILDAVKAAQRYKAINKNFRLSLELVAGITRGSSPCGCACARAGRLRARGSEATSFSLLKLARPTPAAELNVSQSLRTFCTSSWRAAAKYSYSRR